MGASAPTSFLIFKSNNVAKKNAFVHHAVASMVEQIRKQITMLDDADGSHGIIVSSALPNEADAGKQLTTECVVWGTASDMGNMLYAAANHSPVLMQVISNVAIRIATDKLAVKAAKKIEKQSKIITLPAKHIHKPGEA